jgi:hypothetical protein
MAQKFVVNSVGNFVELISEKGILKNPIGALAIKVITRLSIKNK